MSKTERKIEYGKNGGWRPGSGRKKRMEEEQIIDKLSPMEEAAFNMLRRKIDEGDMKAVQIFMNYYMGLPTQKVESKIEGQLNQVSVEIVRPQIAPKETSDN